MIGIPRPGAGVPRRGTLAGKLRRLQPGGYITVRCNGKVAHKRRYILGTARSLGIRVTTRKWGPRTLRVYRLPDTEPPVPRQEVEQP